MENPIKMDDLGVPQFLETPIYVLIKIVLFEGDEFIETDHHRLAQPPGEAWHLDHFRRIRELVIKHIDFP